MSDASYEHEQFKAELKQAIQSLTDKLCALRYTRKNVLVMAQRPTIVAGMHRDIATLVVVDMLLSFDYQSEDTYRFLLHGAMEKQFDMVSAKNLAYGNSALDPVRIFSQASTSEQLLVRIDDKLSRLARGSAAGEDVPSDFVGYLLLLQILENREA